MTTCDDQSGEERLPIDAGLGVDPSPDESTTDLLDDDSADGARYSLRRDTDAHGALIRGLAQYLWTLRVPALGRILEFSRVTEDAAEVEDEATEYPVAAVSGDDEGIYSGPANTPTPVYGVRGVTIEGPTPAPAAKRERVPVVFDTPDGAAGLFEAATYKHERIMAHIWCDSKAERRALVAALEDAAAPHLARSGIYLRLRHYHGVVARYTLVGCQREQSAQEIQSGNWIARFRFVATLPVIRVHRRPRADVRLVAQVGTQLGL